jgi:HEAT repeat protein
MALSAATSEERLTAIAYLSQQADPGVVGVLLEVVRDPDPHLRQSALEALLPLLDANPQVRQGLAQVLQVTQDPEVRQLVTDVLESPEDQPSAEAMSDITRDGEDRGLMDTPSPDAAK